MSGYWYAVSPIVCPVNSQQFISLDRNLLPLENLQASSEGNPAAFLVDPSNGPWCTDRGNGTQPGHHVNLTFTEPVVITMIQSGGFVNGFVNDFAVQYSPSLDGDDFTTYGIIEVPQVSPYTTAHTCSNYPIQTC